MPARLGFRRIDGKRLVRSAAGLNGGSSEPRAAPLSGRDEDPSTPPEMKDGKPVPNTGKEMPGTRKFRCESPAKSNRNIHK